MRDELSSGGGTVGLEGSHRLVNLQISTTATWRTAELRAALRVQIRAPAKVRTLA